MNKSIKERMIDEFRTELGKEYLTLDEIKDSSGEWVEGYLPVYNNEIIKAWQDMPSDYDDKGVQELGISEDAGIIQRMNLDLYLYYTDIFNEAVQELEDELEEANA